MNRVIEVAISILVGLIGCYQLYKIEVKQKGRLIIAIISFFLASAYVSYLITYPWDTLRKMESKYREAQEELSIQDRELDSTIEINEVTTSDALVLPKKIQLKSYEAKQAILDKTIFIGRYYNEFIIGGKNVNFLKLAARTPNGEDVEINKNTSANYSYIEYWQRPYFEIEYKGRYFSIEVEVKGFEPICTVKEIKSLTMELRPF